MNPELAFANQADYAVIIGIRDYPKFGNLNGPLEDAQHFYDWLVDPQKGSVPPANCQLIKSEVIPGNEFPNRPIKSHIDLAFERVWNRLIASGQPARRLYFFFNGHGIGASRTNTALLLANYDLVWYRNDALSSERYLELIISSGRFQEVVFLFDCCRNQLLGVEGMEPSFSWVADAADTGQTAVWIGYAAEYQNKAFEAEMEEVALNPGEQDGSLFRGFFTTALLRGLEGGAADPATGRITPESLKTYIELETPRVAMQKNRRQQARVSLDFPAGKTAFFGVNTFGKTTAEAPFRIERSPARASKIVLWDGQATPLRSSDSQPFPWELSLAVGTYLLEDEATQEQKPIIVRLPIPNEVTQIIF